MSNLGSKIVPSSGIIDYSSLIISRYENQNPSIMRKPFAGFKFLMFDEDGVKGDKASRYSFINTHIGKIMGNTGCILRECNHEIMPNGFWLVSLPVPVSQLRGTEMSQMNRIKYIIRALENSFNIRFMGRTEINISGRCTVAEIPDVLANILISQEDEENRLKPPASSPYNIGRVIPINSYYHMIRTSWDLSRYAECYEHPTMVNELGDKVVQLSYNISSAFH